MYVILYKVSLLYMRQQLVITLAGDNDHVQVALLGIIIVVTKKPTAHYKYWKIREKTLYCN
jgi:hypothetical protein